MVSPTKYSWYHLCLWNSFSFFSLIIRRHQQHFFGITSLSLKLVFVLFIVYWRTNRTFLVSPTRFSWYHQHGFLGITFVSEISFYSSHCLLEHQQVFLGITFVSAINFHSSHCLLSINKLFLVSSLSLKWYFTEQTMSLFEHVFC